MASKEELRKALAAARKSKNSADSAIKRLVDVHVPKQAKKARGNLLARLRRIAKRMAERIPVLRKRIKSKRKSGADKAVKWAKAQVNKTESPYGSNKGPYPVSECQVFTIGYDGVPWCGCFVAYAAIHVGGATIPNKARLAYTPYICADAGASTNGLTRVPFDQVKAGDLVVFNFDGGVPDHVGIAVGPFQGGLTRCIEGNTSSGAGGSQDNGGGVFPRSRPVSQVACVARPNYR